MRAGPRQSRAAATDRGMATVWVAVTTATLCAVFAVVLALGQAVAARHEAAAAADLAALAAADRALLGAAEACEAAREVTGAQGAELVRCAVRGDIADVTARAHFGPYAPEARSRAGPPVAQTPGVPTVSVRLAGTGTGAGTTTGAHGELELPVTVTWTERRWPECLSA